MRFPERGEETPSPILAATARPNPITLSEHQVVKAASVRPLLFTLYQASANGVLRDVIPLRRIALGRSEITIEVILLPKMNARFAPARLEPSCPQSGVGSRRFAARPACGH